MSSYCIAPDPVLLDTNFGLNRVWEKELEILKEKDTGGVVPRSLEGVRSATGAEPDAAAEVTRWSEEGCRPASFARRAGWCALAGGVSADIQAQTAA